MYFLMYILYSRIHLYILPNLPDVLKNIQACIYLPIYNIYIGTQKHPQRTISEQIVNIIFYNVTLFTCSIIIYDHVRKNFQTIQISADDTQVYGSI